MSDQSRERPVSHSAPATEAERTQEEQEASPRDDDRGRTDEDPGALHPDRQSELHERADGAHTEQITDESNFRADPEPPD